MEFGHLLEAVMLVCFGFSWPMNVIKSYKARSAKGMSLGFILLIITGYVAGIAAKFVNHQLNYVLAVYFLNLAIVMVNLGVYFRNKALDRKSEKVSEKKENEIVEEKRSVVLLGGMMDELIPVNALASNFEFNFPMYNKSVNNLSIKDAAKIYENSISKMDIEGIIIHIGNEDISFFMNNEREFDRLYLDFINRIKTDNSKCRIALVSVEQGNSEFKNAVDSMNRHIKALADSEGCVFVNLDNSKYWKPEATKAALDFATGMGLSVRKPLSDVAEILYDYALRHNVMRGADEILVS